MDKPALRTLLFALLLAVVPGAVEAEVPPPAETARISPAGNYLAARHAGQVRDMAAAAAYYRGALRTDPRNPELVERTFLAVIAGGDVEESMPLAERLVGIDRGHRVARLALAARGIKRGQFSGARTHLGQSSRAPIFDLTGALLTGWAHAAAGDVNAAIEAIDRFSAPEAFGWLKDFHVGLILDVAGRRKQAGERLERAYNGDRNSVRTVDAYARWLARGGDRKRALELYAELGKLLPNQPLILAAIAEVESGRPPAPFVRTFQAGAAEVLYALGTVLARQGGDDLGLVYLQLALYLEPTHPLALFALADVHEQMRKPELAIEAYARVPADSPLKRDAEIQHALNLNTLERVDEARQMLGRLVEKRPDHLDTVIALGNVLRAAKEYAEAARVYGKAVALLKTPAARHWTLFYFRGIAHERSKQWPLAEADFQKALELQPDQPDVLNYLGYSWIDMGVRLDEGLELVKRAVTQRPNSGYIVDSLGWAYYRLGRYEEAVRELERAVELRPQDSVINDHLGDAYWRVGRQLEARFQWRHALDLEPEKDEIPKIEAKLRDGLPDAEPPPRAGAVQEKGKGG